MTPRPRRVALALLALASLATALAACNTVKGVGKDITYAGEKTEEAITGKSDKPAK